jgi:hypothetical protein
MSLDDAPRYAGLPLEEFYQPDWYRAPEGCEFVDDFDLPDSGTFSMVLIREKSTGRLALDIWHGEEWEHRLRLPLDVPVDVPSFGVLAKVLSEGGRPWAAAE